MGVIALETQAGHPSSSLTAPLARVVGGLGFVLLAAGMVAILSGDDLQLVRADQEAPTVFNVRLAGVKFMDLLSAALFAIAVLKTALEDRIEWTSVHTAVIAMLGAYLYAGFVGFAYSFFRHYNLTFWVQDLQQTLYMAGYFFLVFVLLDTRRKWRLFVVLILAVMAVKNLLILYNSLMGVGKSIGDWAFRSSQNSEFAYFPMMFFPLLLLFVRSRSLLVKVGIGLLLFTYLFNSLIGIYRTVWVMLILGTGFLFVLLPRSSRLRLGVALGAGLTLALGTISVLFPRFLELAWSFKFASIFDWSVYGERSNSTKLLEIVNVWHHVIGNFAFLQGMGLGAWWDDSARRLLPDAGSGYMFKSRFQTTHMWYVTQFLKLGVVATFVYWGALLHVFRACVRGIRSLPWNRWETHVLLGWFVGFVCAFISSADFVRLFLMVGLNMAVALRWFTLSPAVPAASR